jgi:hypothetical protein
MTEPLGFLPKARRDGLITKEVDGELLIYDRTRDKAHCLNGSAAAIWKLCDGQTTTHEIARQLGSNPTTAPQAVEQDCGVTTEAATQEPDQFDERIVWLALSELRRSHLLEELGDKAPWPQAIMGMSRREAVKWIGIGAALPVVISITAPTAQAAVSNCGHNNDSCTVNSDCCSNLCAPNSPPPGSSPKHCVGS